MVAAALVAAAGAVIPGPARADEARVFTVPPHIASDCSTDVTGKLNNWIDSVPNKSTLSFSPGACYRIEKTVLIKNRHGLTIEGNGATFRAFTDGTGYVGNLQTRNHFYLWGGTNLVVRNLKVQGVNTDHRYHAEYAGQRGFRIAGVQGALLENITIFEVRGDFVEVDPDYYQTWRWSSDITIRNSTFDHSGRQGFTITGGRRIIFADNHISGAALSMFDIEPDGGTWHDAEGNPTGGGAADVQIVNNDVGPAGLLFFGNIVLNENVVTKDITISGNRLRGLTFNVWSTGHVNRHYKRFTITNNTSDTAYAGPRGAVELRYVDGAVISGNRVPFYFGSTAPEVAVKAWGSTDVVVRDNKFPGARIVYQVDPHLFWNKWTGTPGGPKSACNNKYGNPSSLEVDRPCT